MPLGQGSAGVALPILQLQAPLACRNHAGPWIRLALHFRRPGVAGPNFSLRTDVTLEDIAVPCSALFMTWPDGTQIRWRHKYRHENRASAEACGRRIRAAKADVK